MSPEAAQLLEAIHADLHVYGNFFQPVQKLVEKRRDGAKIYKRYDTAQTPHQRPSHRRTPNPYHTTGRDSRAPKVGVGRL